MARQDYGSPGRNPILSRSALGPPLPKQRHGLSGRRVAIGAVLLVLGFLAWRLLASPAAPPATTETDIVDAEDTVVSASAVVLPLRQSKLGFRIAGRVREVRANAGDSVKAGDPIVLLEDDDLQQQVTAARAGLDVAQANLARVLAGSRPQELIAADASYQAALAKQKQAIGPVHPADLQSTQATIAAARERLAQVRAGSTADLKAAESSLAAAQASLDRLVAGPRPEDLRAAELALDQAKNNLWAAQVDRDGVKGNGALPEYMGVAADAKVAAAETAVESSKNALAKLKAGATGDELAAARAAVDQAAALVEVKQGTKDPAIAAAEAEVSSAEAGLRRLRDGPTAEERTQLESAVVAAKAQYDVLRAGATEAEINAARAGVKQAEAALDGALLAAKEAALAAPFDGTVAAVAAQAGQVLAPGEPIVTFGDLTALQIETTDLRETGVARIRAGQSVTVTFDALPDQTLFGKVISVAKVSSAAAGGTNFTVKIDLPNPSPDLRWGMTANVEIATEPKP